MRLLSTAFEDSLPIPEEHTCVGNDINPELRI